MRDETQRESVRSLQPPVRSRPPWRRRIVRLVISIAACAVIVRETRDFARFVRGTDCASLTRSAPLLTRIKVCQEEFEDGNDPKTGARLATHLVRAGELERARRVAMPLQSTSVRADILQVLGNIAMYQGRFDDAVVLLEEARFLHRFMGESLELARDDAVLATVRTERSEFLDALRLLNECIWATRGRDKIQECHCHTVAARTLVSLGYFAAAKDELHDAEKTVQDDDARLHIAYQRGNVEQEVGDHDGAAARFQTILESRDHFIDPEQTIVTEENLAYSLAELNQLDEAQRHLDRATQLDRDHKQTPGRTWTAARIAFGRRDFARAASLVNHYFELVRIDDSATADDRIDVASLGARIELDRGRLGAAEDWARQAVEEAEKVRTQTVLDLRPWILTKRRKAYELLFLAFARAGQVEKAAMAFNQWQGRTVYDVLAQPGPRAPQDRSGVIDQIARIRRWAATSRPLFSAPADHAAVLSTLRQIDLLAVIVADDEVWRLVVEHGSLRLSRVGPLEGIREGVVRLASHPTKEVEQGAALAAVLVPEQLFRKTLDTLYVVIDSRLAMLPPAALRRGGIPLGALRPIVRPLRLPDTTCVHVTRAGHRTVIGGADDSLVTAKDEVRQVANLLGTTGITGPAATRSAVLAGTGDAVLHIAAHTTNGTDGAAIVLADGELPGLEIAAQPVGPSLAVLSECNAAVSNISTSAQDDAEDVELVDSLAAAFLIAGSQQVVASLRSVTDAGTLNVIQKFYRADGVSDPARALHLAQSELWNDKNNEDWPLFAVFGSDVCR